jgi:hypothetical protein
MPLGFINGEHFFIVKVDQLIVRLFLEIKNSSQFKFSGYLYGCRIKAFTIYIDKGV